MRLAADYGRLEFLRVLRSHQVGPGGVLRDTCVYSVLAHEWPAHGSYIRSAGRPSASRRGMPP